MFSTNFGRLFGKSDQVSISLSMNTIASIILIFFRLIWYYSIEQNFYTLFLLVILPSLNTHTHTHTYTHTHACTFASYKNSQDIYIYISAIDCLSIIWKSDLTDKMKRSFFQAAVVSILLYGGTTWTLAKRLEKKLDGNYSRILREILNKSWRQHPTRHQLYGHLPPITKTIQVRPTRHAGHC